MKDKQPNFTTPIKEILFRSSSVGILAEGLMKNDITDLMREEMKYLEAKKKTLIGLTDLQRIQLKEWNKYIKTGGKLTERNATIRKKYMKRLRTYQKLTPQQEQRLENYKYREGAEPELSTAAKNHIKEVWLWYEKGFKKEIKSKQTDKGKQGEEAAISLIAEVDGEFYVNNNKNINKGRVTIGNLTGACDVNTSMKIINKRVIDDCKCSWDPLTFMMSTYTKLEEWQGRSYMYLYDADIFRLRRCLIDCPADVYEEELDKFCWKHKIIDPSFEEYRSLLEQFDRNFLYEHSGKYNKEERVKTFSFVRDKDLELILLLSVDLAVEYYQTITLNMIE